jgi:hypothetical protein
MVMATFTNFQVSESSSQSQLMKRKITLDIENHPRESLFLYSFGSRKTTRVPQEFIFFHKYNFGKAQTWVDSHLMEFR